MVVCHLCGKEAEIKHFRREKVLNQLREVFNVPLIMCEKYQMSFVVIGALTILLAFCRSWPLLVAAVLGMGLVDGCFISLLGPIAFQLVGPTGASQAIGFLLTLCSVPLTVGPPVAGVLYDHWQSYQLAFVLAGCPPILAALLMCLIHRIPATPSDDEVRHKAAALGTALEPHQMPQCEELLGASAHILYESP